MNNLDRNEPGLREPRRNRKRLWWARGQFLSSLTPDEFKYMIVAPTIATTLIILGASLLVR